MKTTLAERIAQRRVELGLRPVDLANAAGVSVSAVMQWESGETKNVKLAPFFAIADALNVHPRWLATEEGPKEAGPNQIAYSTALARRDTAESPRGRLAWERIAAAFARAAVVVVCTIPPFTAERAQWAISHKSNCYNHSCAKSLNVIHIVASLWRSLVTSFDQIVTAFSSSQLQKNPTA